MHRFEQCVNDRAFYEAQQVAKTVYHRYRSQKRLEESKNLLADCAKLQLENSEVACGVELAMLLLEAYHQESVPEDNVSTARIYKVLDTFEQNASSSAAEYGRIVVAAIKWASSIHSSAGLIKDLHGRLAQFIWKARGLDGFASALAHFVRSNAMAKLADMLNSAFMVLTKTEAELLTARACLQLLGSCQADTKQMQLELARELLKQLNFNHLPSSSSLLVFIRLLMEALDRNSIELVHMLQREYSTELNWDEEIFKEVNDVVRVYFRSTARTEPNLDSMFGNILRSLTQSA